VDVNFPLEFRPMRGTLSLLERGAEALGLEHLWAGPDGIGAVATEALKDLGVPERSIALTGADGILTPRAIAENVGLIKKRRKPKKG